jgi:hypothetical protein
LILLFAKPVGFGEEERVWFFVPIFSRIHFADVPGDHRVQNDVEHKHEQHIQQGQISGQATSRLMNVAPLTTNSCDALKLKYWSRFSSNIKITNLVFLGPELH